MTNVLTSLKDTLPLFISLSLIGKIVQIFASFWFTLTSISSLNEVQRVYRATGVYISDKHVEVIVRQMLRFVQVSELGDTALLPGDLIDRFSFTHANEEILAQGGEPAQARPALLGLTKTALRTTSWIAAASFQETSKVLTNAAIRGQVDSLKGYKERIVLGARIPRSVA